MFEPTQACRKGTLLWLPSEITKVESDGTLDRNQHVIMPQSSSQESPAIGLTSGKRPIRQLERDQWYAVGIAAEVAVFFGVLAIPDSDLAFGWRLGYSLTTLAVFLLLSVLYFARWRNNPMRPQSGTAGSGDYLLKKAEVSDRLHDRLRTILTTPENRELLENYPATSSFLNSLPLIHSDEVERYRLEAKKAVLFDDTRLFNRNTNRRLRVEQLAFNAIGTMTIPDRSGVR